LVGFGFPSRTPHRTKINRVRLNTGIGQLLQQFKTSWCLEGDVVDEMIDAGAVGLALHPTTGELWVSTNERDGLGDNLVPDYLTRVKEGGFYGWPWFYMGGHQDPRLVGTHPELKSKVITPDVLVQPHMASLGMTFYPTSKSTFPSQYSGDGFAAEHGSWNRANRGGYEVIRIPMKNGKATGEYEDFLTGFVTADGQVWGRPVGVTVGHDGALYVTDDGSRSIWRVTYTGK